MRKVEITEYQREWAEAFKAESEKLHEIFKDELIEIHHIGSTAVPGMKAKPVIDMIPVVRKIQCIDQYTNAIRAIGYEPKGEHGLTGRRFFRKGGDKRTHHVHMYEVNHPDIERHLIFRDFLKAHPEKRNQYSKLKERLAEQFPFDMEAYIKGKHAFIKSLEREAIRWGRHVR